MPKVLEQNLDVCEAKSERRRFLCPSCDKHTVLWILPTTEIKDLPIEVMYMSSMEYEMRCRCYFSAVWEFLLGNRDKCLTYVRYFYSPYFTKYSSEEHKRRFVPLVEKIRVAFKDEAEVWMILNHILNVMLAFAVMVHTGQMKNESDSAEHVFRVVYRSVEQYFRN